MIPSVGPQIPIPVAPPSATAAVEPVKKSDTDNKSKQQDSQSGDNQQQENRVKTVTQMTNEERSRLRSLAQTDREVRAHEAAHKAAAGQYARSGAKLEYERGPDGRLYATGGEVDIDTSVPDDPQEALLKAQTILRAALAPANPSAQDRAVAAEAAQMANDARAKILSERTEGEDKQSGSTENNNKKAVNSYNEYTEAALNPLIDTAV